MGESGTGGGRMVGSFGVRLVRAGPGDAFGVVFWRTGIPTRFGPFFEGAGEEEGVSYGEFEPSLSVFDAVLLGTEAGEMGYLRDKLSSI